MTDDKPAEKEELNAEEEKVEEERQESDPVLDPSKGPTLETSDAAVRTACLPPACIPKEPDVEDNRLLAAFSYIGILFVVPLLAKKRSDFAIFHCRQGIVLFALWAILSFIAWIPRLGPIVYLITLAVSVFAFVQAYRGERWQIPFLGKYAKMLKI